MYILGMEGNEMDKCKWQWISDHYGPMGCFSDEEKSQHEGTDEFTNGHWQALSEKEVNSMVRYIGRLAYEQS
jgi:hypothetical protein